MKKEKIFRNTKINHLYFYYGMPMEWCFKLLNAWIGRRVNEARTNQKFRFVWNQYIMCSLVFVVLFHFISLLSSLFLFFSVSFFFFSFCVLRGVHSHIFGVLFRIQILFIFFFFLFVFCIYVDTKFLMSSRSYFFANW